MVMVQAFAVGESITFTTLEKIVTFYGKIVNIPPGTVGTITGFDEDDQQYTIECFPPTTAFKVSFTLKASEETFLGHLIPSDLPDTVEVLPESQWYDEEMPGFLTRNEYLVKDPKNDGYVLLYNRQPFTDWEVELHGFSISENKEKPLQDYNAYYRTTYKGNHQCEQFSLVNEYEEYSFMIGIFKHKISFFSTFYAIAEVKPVQKRILIFQNPNRRRKRYGLYVSLKIDEYSEYSLMNLRDLPLTWKERLALEVKYLLQTPSAQEVSEGQIRNHLKLTKKMFQQAIHLLRKDLLVTHHFEIPHYKLKPTCPSCGNPLFDPLQQLWHHRKKKGALGQ
jgi:hypothetical protein